MKTLRTLFFEFLWLGLITFGGGLAMLPTIRQIALKHHWIEEKDWEVLDLGLSWTVQGDRSCESNSCRSFCSFHCTQWITEAPGSHSCGS
jgi:hypothetical protein